MLKTALVTIVGCVLALFILVSVISSNQASRERQKQEAIRELDRKNAEQVAWQEREAASVTAASQATQAQRDLEVNEDIANLRSSDREVVNQAIQRIQYYKSCKAVPDLVDLLKENPDDYIAGVSAQTIAVCKDRSTYDTIVDQFLRRNATPAMIYAVGEIDTSDERVPEKLDRLISEPNQGAYVPKIARRVKNQFQLAQNNGH
jgi:hypothetical protein